MVAKTSTLYPAGWQEMKRKYPDAIILFRAGSSYSMFSNDAIEAADILGISICRHSISDDEIAVAADFPQFALNEYMQRFLRAGYRVVICDNTEPIKPNVKRSTATA